MSNQTKVIAEPDSFNVRIERVFDAPREKVFQIFTSKDYLEKWWNPFGEATIEIDARDGGSWKFGGDGVTFFGVFHEIAAPDRIIQTSEFAELGERGHVILEKYDFTEQADGSTLVVATETFLSAGDRDGLLQSGMEEGLVKNYEKIDALLAEDN